MREALDGMDWHFSMDCSTDISWENFISILNSIIDKFVPKRSHTYSYKKPWMNSVTAETIDKKRMAWIKLRNCSSDNNISAYKQSRNEATNVIRTAKFEYEKNILSKVKDEPNFFWSYVKSKCKTRDKVCDLMKADGTLTNSGKDKAEVLNDFFVSVFTKENLSFIPTLPDRNFEHVLETFIITSADVLKKKKLSALKASKSAGLDGLHCKFLLELKDSLCDALTNIFNKSLESGEVPKQWKRVHVSPIFKKGDKKQPENYRPVSLTCVVCKTMEFLVRDKLM